MSRHLLPAALRWLAILAGAGLLLLVGPALVRRGIKGRAAPVYLTRASGQAAPAERALADIAALGISGPQTMTVKAVSFEGGVRRLGQIRPVAKPVLPELGVGENMHTARRALSDPALQSSQSGSPPGSNMPGAVQNFAGLDFNCCGAGYPPDTNGDVGPNHYVQTVNTSIGIFSKTGTQLAALTFDALFSGGGTSTGTPCDTSNNGDPVALYDAQADRFIVADFAWTNLDGGPYYECIAASKTGDPTGDWWKYAVRADDDGHKWLNDYPKLGVWPDGIYMSANMFECLDSTCSQNTYQGARVWALNRDDLYSGAALRVVRFDAGAGYFTLLPGNIRMTASGGQSAALAGAFRSYLPTVFNGQGANYFVSNDFACCGLDVFKFQVDWANPSASTFSSPTLVNVAAYNEPASGVPETGAPDLDSLGSRLMMQNQYRNIGGKESLWIAHTADMPAGIRWYQLDVTGGTVATTPVQQGTYSPDTKYRWMPSLAVDKLGNMAVGYSVSSAGQHPDIRYAGRLASDPPGTLGQGETTLVSGGGSQTSCFVGACARWGDYSAMTVDPVDGCTFWYTTEYYTADGGDWQTRIGSFRLASC